LKDFLVLEKKTSAIQLIPDSDGRIKLGTLLHLPAGARVEVNGEGFNAETTRVSWQGSCYYIFLDEISNQSYRTSAQAVG
jgi:hypothetical protein